MKRVIHEVGPWPMKGIDKRGRGVEEEEEEEGRIDNEVGKEEGQKEE